MSRAYLKSGSVDTHVKVWVEANGPVPKGMDIHHVDHDKHNNALSNLVLMTPAEHSAHHNQIHPNFKDCVVCGETYEPPVKHRGRSRTCSYGCFCELMSKQRTENNGMRKLSAEQVAEIRNRVDAGERKSDLSREYEVSKATLTRVTKSEPLAAHIFDTVGA